MLCWPDWGWRFADALQPTGNPGGRHSLDGAGERHLASNSAPNALLPSNWYSPRRPRGAVIQPSLPSKVQMLGARSGMGREFDFRGPHVGRFGPNGELAVAAESFVADALAGHDVAGQAIHLLRSADGRDVAVQDFGSGRSGFIRGHHIVFVEVRRAVERIQRNRGGWAVPGVMAREQVTVLDPLKLSLLMTCTIFTILRAVIFWGVSKTQLTLSVPAPGWQSAQSSPSESAMTPMALRKSSGLKPLSASVVTFLKHCPALAPGAQVIDGAWALALPENMNPIATPAAIPVIARIDRFEKTS